MSDDKPTMEQKETSYKKLYKVSKGNMTRLEIKTEHGCFANLDFFCNKENNRIFMILL